MTVGMLRESMTNEEFLHWSIYFGREQQRQELSAKGG